MREGERGKRKEGGGKRKEEVRFPKCFVPFSLWFKYHSFRPFTDQICDLLACSLSNFDAKLATDDKGEMTTSYWGYTCKPNGTNLTGTATV